MKNRNFIPGGLGMLIAGTLGFFLGYNKGKHGNVFKIDELIPEINQNAKDVEKRVMDLFDKVSGKTKGKWETLQKDFFTKLSEVQASAKSIDKKKYRELVEEFVEQIKGEEEFSDKQLGLLKDYLEDDYKIVKKSLTS